MAGPGFSQNQLTFIIELADQTGLDVGVICAWCIAEEPAGANATVAGGDQNWLNIGWFDSGPGSITKSQAFGDPKSAADQTAKFLAGTWGGASPGIRAILNTVRQSPGAQIAAIQQSGWASSGYPDLPSIYHSLDAGFLATLGAKVQPGGTAGMGGTGTAANGSPQSTYTFQVGSSDNPDEDYWTAANRLAQEVNWYLFSDAETIFYVDGADLIAQSVSSNARIDRTKNADRIVHFQATYDNTSYQFVSTHRRKSKVQRKTRLTQVTSPTQFQLSLICGVDEFRAGDLFVLSGFGPADGRWIIGDARRSVFNVYTEFTLVPPIMPLAEAQVAGTTGKSSGATSTSTSGAGVLSGSARDKVVQVAKKAIARQASQHAYQYAEVRPYPGSLFGPAPVITDCSGFSILCYKDAGQSDPNGTNFDGSGNTDSLIARGTPVSSPQPADLVFYPGHVAVFLGGGQIANMGSPGEPVQESIGAPHGGNIIGIRSYL